MAKGTVDQSRICGEERTRQQKNIKHSKQVEQFAKEQIIDKYRHRYTTWLQALPQKKNKKTKTKFKCSFVVSLIYRSE